jgi:hypothetical protein
MPRPTSATTIQRPDLGSIAFEYMMEASQRGFIGLQIMPIFEVPLQSADYPVIPIEALLKLFDTSRSPRGDYNRSDYEFKTGTFSCKEHGWEEAVDDTEAALYRRFFDAEEVAVMRCVDIILRSQEARIAAKVQSTANITATAAVSVPWNTSATCTPRADVNTAKTAMRAASGLTPNVMAISKKVFDTLLVAKEITDALQYTNPLQINSEEIQRRLLSQYFGLEVLVGNAIKDSAKKGQTYTIADIWDDEYCGLYKVSNGGQDLRDPCLGRTFLWTEDSPSNLVTEQYREEKKRSEIYRTRQNTDEAFVFKGAGYLLSNVIHP